MSAACHALRRTSRPSLSLDEAQLDAVLSRHTTAPHALDHLEVHPCIHQRDGLGFRPLIVIVIGDRPMIMSADTGRRLAVMQESRGREGAAHDLLGACDMAETLAASLETLRKQGLH